MTRRDYVALAIIGAVAAALFAFRIIYFEPRAWGTACQAGGGPRLICGARTLLGLAQYHQMMGTAAALLGLWALIGAPFAIVVAAVCAGLAGLIDYNVSWGMLGTALGVWAWLRAPAPSRPGSARRSPTAAIDD